MIRRGLLLVASGIVLVSGALVVAYAFDALLPDDARFWFTVGLLAMALGCFLLGGVSFVGARTLGAAEEP